MITQIRVGILGMDEATQFYATVRSGFDKFYSNSQSKPVRDRPHPIMLAHCSPTHHL